MKRFLFLFLAVSGLSVFGQTKNQKVLAYKLDSAFAKIFKSDAPGGSIFIQQGNKILYQKSFGLADMKTKEKFTPATVSNTGSISKTFVAYAILILKNEGKLSLDDNLLKYFPEFKNKEIAQKVTIKHMLTHTSGLPDLREVEKDSVFYLTAKDAENFHPLTLANSLEFEPGTRYEYSNPCFNGLALIVEKVSGMRWQDFITKRIFLPAGMKNSKITDGSYPDKGVAHAYQLINNQYQEFDYGEYPTFTASGNGGVWSSINELRKYLNAINSCKFTDAATIKLSKTLWDFPNWNSKETNTRTPVWFVHKKLYSRYNSPEQCMVIEHSGSQAGFRAHFVLIPENHITVIWLTNNNTFITPEIQKALLEAKYIQ